MNIASHMSGFDVLNRRVRAFYGVSSEQTHVEGRAFAVGSGPEVHILLDNGERTTWQADLCEVLPGTLDPIAWDEITTPLDRARNAAVALEQEHAELTRLAKAVVALPSAIHHAPPLGHPGCAVCNLRDHLQEHS